ncbi:MAG TPA: bifunctional 3-(3-hydroxy-phenyl)propionate/3-hydroxycinnamic acid hydroxylase [Rubricoccaceae bacterium]|nr:bifunctional 3-(3-hydroxy-phenyl)propionate/3-hydroxycinnamic acid hydroxylase [Rubricoccaceae bacterium]
MALVGYGPVGALLANLLGARGLRVLVLEREAAPWAIPRAAHLDDEALRILQLAGLHEKVLSASRPLDGMDLVTGDGRLLLRAFKKGAADEPLGFPAATLVHQPDVERVLRDGAARFPSVEVRLGHEVVSVEATGDEGVLTVHGAGETYRARARFVVGGDGARSLVRAAMQSPLRPVARFTQDWLVVDTLLTRDVPLPDRLLQVCSPSRPTTFVPFPGRRRRWEFMLRQGETPEAVEQPGMVRRLLARWVDPEAVEVERAAVYTFRSVVARGWRKGPLLLAGDAAHQMPPFLGQGLGAGLRDAAFLGWSLPLVVTGRADASLLDAYEQERRPHVETTIRWAVFAGRAIALRGVAARTRDRLLRALHRVPPAARSLRRVEADLSPRRAVLRGGRGRHAGRLLPQPRVVLADGSSVRLDEVLGDGFAVVGLNQSAEAWAGRSPVWRTLGARFVCLLSPEAPLSPSEAGEAVVRAPDGKLMGWARGAAALVVRPDRRVFGFYGEGEGGRAAREVAAALRLRI